MALVVLFAGLVSQVEVKSELKNESKNSEISKDGEFGLSNPSAVYCKELGYGYEIKNTKEGQIGVCIFPDGSSAEDWEFYSGETKGEYSYCAAKGYKLETEKNCAWSSKCGVCVLPDGKKISAFVLMLKEKPKKDYLKKFYENIEEGQFQKSPLENGPSFKDLSQISSVGLLTSFDWRNKDGGDWLTPVKNQGACGSCWAFASVGAHESQIDIKSNNPATDKNLAEQYLVADCFLPADCGGLYLSDIPTLFNFHKDNGIVDEGCYPYVAANSACNPCSDYSNRLLKIEDWYPVTADITKIKTALTTEGPLWVGIYMSSSFDANNIMRCTLSQDSSINHAVVLVGYNDDGQYWIVRNSWGANWGPDKNGYFKVGYGECNIDSYAYGYYQDIIALKGEEPIGPDADGDGVPDSNDACPNTAGTDCNGCPNLCSGCAVMSCDAGTLNPPTCASGTCPDTVCPANGCGVDSCALNEYGIYTVASNTCNIVDNAGVCENNQCGLSCAYDPICEAPPAEKCWDGANLYLYKDSAQAKKFCKCAQGVYGYNSYKYNRSTKTAGKYNDTADNTAWDATKVSTRNLIYSVTCADRKAYLTNQDYSYPKQLQIR